MNRISTDITKLSALCQIIADRVYYNPINPNNNNFIKQFNNNCHCRVSITPNTNIKPEDLFMKSEQYNTIPKTRITIDAFSWDSDSAMPPYYDERFTIYISHDKPNQIDTQLNTISHQLKSNYAIDFKIDEHIKLLRYSDNSYTNSLIELSDTLRDTLYNIVKTETNYANELIINNKMGWVPPIDNKPVDNKPINNKPVDDSSSLNLSSSLHQNCVIC